MIDPTADDLQRRDAEGPDPLEGSRRPRLDFPIAGIGCSAGGLEALEDLLKELSGAGMAFVLVQHMAPGHVAMLGQLLSRRARLPVELIEDTAHLEPGRLYVAPTDVELSVEGDDLTTGRPVDPRRRRQSIDAFFRSLAHAAGPRALGIVLSGAGSDGTLGLREIRNEGGVTFVQAPASAIHAGMPESAIHAGVADFVLTPSEIGKALTRLDDDAYLARLRVENVVDLPATAKIYTRLREAYGIDFSQYKQSSIERRIARRMALHKVDKVDDYVALLDLEGGELRSLYGDLLIGVTSFFRDAEVFDALRTVVFPRVIEKSRADASIRIWVPGCSTGEEAYSVAITLLEVLGHRAGDRRIQIFATDVDEHALARARAAVYPANIDAYVPASTLQRFFVRAERGYQIARHVRELVAFARHDIGSDPPFSRLDLVTCRNLLIYMAEPLQKRVLRTVHYALKPDAYLLLGSSESIGDSPELFATVDRAHKIYAKKSAPAAVLFDFAPGRTPPDAGGFAGSLLPREPLRKPTVAQLADRRLIERYAPPGVVVDDRLDVVQLRGRTGPYLESASGTTPPNLLELARPELLDPLRSAVRDALASERPAAAPPVIVQTERGARSVTVEAVPLVEGAGPKALLVVFCSAYRAAATPAEGPAPGPYAAIEAASRVDELERELAANEDRLQSVIAKLETANEELEGANEELHSSNEEMQSTNEELETSREELRSTNEELALVNEELNGRLADLKASDDDLRNVLNATGAILLLVGADLSIRRFSAAAGKLLDLTSRDVGQPIARLRSLLGAEDLATAVLAVIETATARTGHARRIDGAWYTTKIAPYLTDKNAIRGAVIELAKRAPPSAPSEREPLAAPAQGVLSALPHPVMLIDERHRLVWANRACLDVFSLGPEAIERPLADVWGSTTEPPELWAFLEDLAAGRAVRDVVIARPFGRSNGRPMRFSGAVVSGEVGRPWLGLVSMTEV